ncbi:H(+)/Cl(-) exchange transporter ClcA [Afipia felis]|uniref:H(+)/Cl(-) exchange transporter ClcA n=1 Tax=Afipia felis TaxID=1035 RepID=A0A090MUZ6_AFIFE|nr:chloride channel protein [Afipia felis]RTL78474.1 MAG: chloride channel protein [Bradyrhizobiaceae bacterium]CEG10237.1 H(+)/Cl(-) exchange transporter ClcA [Afipia felis]
MSRSSNVAPRLGDFTADKRVLVLVAMALLVGSGGAASAWVLLHMIALVTNLVWLQTFSTANLSLAGLKPSLWMVLAPGLGGLIIGLMARYGSEKIRGHGIPEAIEAILIGGSRMQPKVAVLKPLSSAISIGSGGPFGAEGPIIMTGGAIGSLFAQCFHMSAAERKTLLVAGAAAGMTAIFGTPIAAMLLSVELLLFEMKPRSLIPVITACVVSAAWRPFIIGHGPLFPFSGHLDLPWWGVFLYIAVGIVGGLQSGLITAVLYKAEDLFERLPVHWMWWPAIGGLLVGLGGLIEPRALGVGYDIIAGLLNDKIVTSQVLTILIVKSVIWIIALASGTSGGVLAPLLIFGGCLAWLEGLFLPGDTGAWALLGMAAMMGGTMRSPLTGIMFAVELTGHFGLLEPLLVCTGAAYALTVLLLKRSILTEKIARRGQHVVREYSIDPFELLRVSDVMVKNVDTLPASMRVDEAVAFFCGDTPPLHKSYPLIDENGVVVGVVGRRDILRWRAENPETDETLFDCISDSSVVIGYPDEQVAVLADRMVATEAGRVPIVDRASGRLVGLMTRKDLMRTRGNAISAETDRLSYFLRRKKLSATTG